MMNKQERTIIGVTSCSHGLVHLYENVLPPLIPILAGVFNTDYFHLGLVVTIFSYAFGFGSLPSGFLADHLGPRRLVTIYLFGSGIVSLFFWFTSTLPFYAAVMGLVGLFCSTYHPASNTLISQSIREKGKAFGIHGIAGSIGVAAAPALSASIGSAAGWKAPHILFGLFGICAGIYSLSLRASGPALVSNASPADAEDAPAGIPFLKLTIFFFSALCLGLSYKGIMTFLPTYMGESVHIGFLKLDPVSLGGTVATIALFSGALGQYIAGRLVDRFQPEKVYLFVLVAATLFVFTMALSTNLVLVLAVVFYALVYFAAQPTQNYILADYAPKNRRGLIYGTHFFLSFGVGSSSAALSGYLADHYGLKSVFLAMGGCFVMASIFALFLVLRSGRRAPA